jgi:cytochrome c
MDFNKLFAAILVAAIVAMLSGFISREVVNAEAPEENAFKVAVTEGAGTGGAAAVAKAEPILALIKDADVSKGEGISKACAACHSFGKGEAARVGPNLYGIVGNKHAHMEGFAYSDAMKALHDKTWTYEELNEFLYAPAKHIPGTKMTFAGIKKSDQRADLIAWLRTLADSPAPLPSDAEISQEQKDLGAPAADAAPAGDAGKGEAKEGEAKDGAKADAAKADDKKDADKKDESKPAEKAAH